jgi:sugar (pentulose or hexulose) kinase
VTTATAVAAADLGASGGRVMVGTAGPGQLVLHEAHRFGNVPVTALGTLHWDILRLYGDILAGLRAAAGEFELASVGIDSWGVDYGLLDADGALLGNPVHYRDARTAGVAERVHASVGRRETYQVTGTAQLPLNTIYQLVAARDTPQFAAARTLLLIPDLIGYWLTGEAGAEITNASTTGLLDGRARAWATALMAGTGIPPGIFPALRRPGSTIGELRGEIRDDILGGAAAGGARPLPVIAVGSHDTASAVAAVPASGASFAYISCGTWSLAGVELGSPVLTEASREAGFTNEAGVDGTVRFLRNVMGLWLLQESVRVWGARGQPPDLPALLAAAAAVPALRAVVDPDDPAFLPPGDMPERIAGFCRRTGQPVPDSRAEIVRCILDSLALAHRRAILAVQELSGQQAGTVHIVGGGARNALLCQLTADACGLPVVAGPAEAAALGNVLVQARALHRGPDDLAGMRALIRATQPLRRYEPGDPAPWQAAARRLTR